MTTPLVLLTHEHASCREPALFDALRGVRRLGRRILSRLAGDSPPPPGRIDGPASVARSLRDGLGRIGRRFHFNPPAIPDGAVVGVLNGRRALALASTERREGRIERLIAGPNLEVPLLIEAAEAEGLLVPCAWVRDLFESLRPGIGGRVKIWPSGIDTDVWCPGSTDAREQDLLIYYKTGGQALLNGVLAALDRAGLTSSTVTYGSYGPAEFLRELQRSRAMLFLSESESQGIALFEAWSCDVPTLVWDRGYFRAGDGSLRWDGATSAPYLTEACGMSFDALEGLPDRLAEFWQRRSSFRPRQFVLDNHTLSIAAGRYLDICGLSIE